MKKKRTRKKKIKIHNLHISRLFPNLVTIAGLCIGLSSIRFALQERWELAATFLIIAALLDGVDGKLARLFKATSNFGAQLDSLSDFINFGFAPALVIYLWQTQEIKGFGWAVLLFFVICAAIRLARFNTSLDDDEKPEWSDKFFVGIPAPAGAMLLISPMVFSFWLRDSGFFYDENMLVFKPAFLCIFMAIIGILMASRIPTFSIKKVTFRSEYTSIILIAGSLYAAVLLVETWLTVTISSLLYMLHIPFSVASFYHLKYPKEKVTKQ